MNLLFYRKIKTAWGTAIIIFSHTELKYLYLPRTKPQLKLTGQLISKPPDWVQLLEKKIVNYFLGKKVLFDLNRLDLSKYTDFQKKVLNTLAGIPYGQTISYKELAKKAGHPKASRAVGNIMAHNRFPLILPCHRVVKSNGKLGCFGYGENYKQRMLKLEKAL